jgi:hypothetical protein
MPAKTNDRLRPLIVALRMLVRQTNPLHDRLLTAERAINDYLSPVFGAARRSALKRLGEAVRNEAKERPSETDFWRDVEAFIQQRLGATGSDRDG